MNPSNRETSGPKKLLGIRVNRGRPSISIELLPSHEAITGRL